MLKYQATAYIRLSYTDDRSSESDSVTNQRKLIENFIKRNPDIEIISEKIDDGYSGIIFDRPAFKEMMQDITDGKINCVIVKDLSRLGREYIETGRYLRRVFPAYGVRFIAINDNYDTTTLIQGLNDAGIETNTELTDFYTNSGYAHTGSVQGVYLFWAEVAGKPGMKRIVHGGIRCRGSVLVGLRGGYGGPACARPPCDSRNGYTATGSSQSLSTA